MVIFLTVFDFLGTLSQSVPDPFEPCSDCSEHFSDLLQTCSANVSVPQMKYVCSIHLGRGQNIEMNVFAGKAQQQKKKMLYVSKATHVFLRVQEETRGPIIIQQRRTSFPLLLSRLCLAPLV